MTLVIELPVSSGALQRSYFSLIMSFISVFGDLFFLVFVGSHSGCVCVYFFVCLLWQDIVVSFFSGKRRHPRGGFLTLSLTIHQHGVFTRSSLRANSLIPVLLIVVFCYAVWSDSEEALIRGPALGVSAVTIMMGGGNHAKWPHLICICVYIGHAHSGSPLRTENTFAGLWRQM
jgi:hypothetical protein